MTQVHESGSLYASCVKSSKWLCIFATAKGVLDGQTFFNLRRQEINPDPLLTLVLGEGWVLCWNLLDGTNTYAQCFWDWNLGSLIILLIAVLRRP